MRRQPVREETDVVVVTGASSGIGRATAVYLAQHGFMVFAGVRRREDGAALRADAGSQLRPVLFDITDISAIERAASEIADEIDGARIFGLINNAGINMSGPLEYVDIDDFRRCLEVNVLGTAAVTRTFLPLLRSPSGRIINIGSAAGRVAGPLVGGYCASKYAVEALSDALRMELHRSGIFVSIVEPGVVDTPLLDKGNYEIDRARVKLPPDAPDYYRVALRKLRNRFEKSEGMRTSPKAVAEVIHSALKARRPKARYVIGRDAKMLLLLSWLMPTRALDAIFRNMFDL